jgi:hypothetical protein
MATKKIATAMGSSGSDDGGSEAALAGAEKAPEAVSNPNMAAKRTATVMGSSGSSPPRKRFYTTSTYQDPRYVMHFEVFLFLLFCVGLLTLVSALQGVEPKRHTFSPGVRSPWHFQGWCPPQGSAIHDDGAPVLETTSAVDATAGGGGTTATTDPAARASSSLLQTGAATTSSNDDDMLKVIMGHPCLQAPGLIPLPEPLDVAHSTLSQVRLVFQREWDELGVKQQCLMD